MTIVTDRTSDRLDARLGPASANERAAVRATLARRLREELVDEAFLDRMMASVDAQGLRLTGESGFLPELVKAVLERGPATELTGHVGYEKGDPAGRGAPNSPQRPAPWPA